MIDRVLEHAGDLGEPGPLLAGYRLLEVVAAEASDRVSEPALRAFELLDGRGPGDLRDVRPVIDFAGGYDSSSDASRNDVVPCAHVDDKLEDRMRSADRMRRRLHVSDAVEEIAQRRPVPRLASE